MEILPEENTVTIEERPDWIYPVWIKAVYDLKGTNDHTTVTFFRQGGVSITNKYGHIYLNESQHYALRMLFRQDMNNET